MLPHDDHDDDNLKEVTSPKNERPVPLTVTEIGALARKVSDGECSIIPSDHFKKRARERDFSVQDVLEVFRTGTVRPTPLWNEKTEDWNYDIDGLDIEGDVLRVRVAPNSSNSGLVLVTAF